MGYIFRPAYCTDNKHKYRLQVGKKLCECPQCGCKGFTYGKWYLCYYDARKRKIEVPIGRLQDAKRILKIREADVAKGKLGIYEFKPIRLNDLVLGDYCKLHLSRLKSKENYLYKLKRHILPEFGEMYLNQIKQIDVERWLESLISNSNPYTAAYRNQLLNMLKGIYTFANQRKLTEHNPVRQIKCLPVHNEIVRFLTDEQYAALIEAAEHEYLRAAICIAVGTLLRKSNLFGLRWDEHIDIVNRLITIPGSMMKNGRPVTIPIIAPVFETLRTLTRHIHSPYVLTNLRTGTRFYDIKDSFNKAKKKARIDPAFRWHDLRHTGASWLAMAGVPSRTIMTLMNISTESVLKRYAHLSPDHLRDQADKMSHYFSFTSEKYRKSENA